jgi:hypothetical protein
MLYICNGFVKKRRYGRAAENIASDNRYIGICGAGKARRKTALSCWTIRRNKGKIPQISFPAQSAGAANNDDAGKADGLLIFYWILLKEVKNMPQLKLNVTGMASKEDSRKLIAKAEEVPNVRMVNANFETGVVVITHADGLDVDAVKKAIADAGFNAA